MMPPFLTDHLDPTFKCDAGGEKALTLKTNQHNANSRRICPPAQITPQKQVCALDEGEKKNTKS
jgi:hypothetical protein